MSTQSELVGLRQEEGEDGEQLDNNHDNHDNHPCDSVRATTQIEALFAAHAHGGQESLKALRNAHVVVRPSNRTEYLVEFAFSCVFQSMVDIHHVGFSVDTMMSVVELYLDCCQHPTSSIVPSPRCIQMVLPLVEEQTTQHDI